MSTYSNTMEAGYKLLVPTSSDIPFFIRVRESQNYIPFSLFKNPYAVLTTQMEILPPPTITYKIFPVKDTFVRSDFPLMNYGTDGAMTARTVVSPASDATMLMSYDISKLFATNPKSALLSIKLKGYNSLPSTVGNTAQLYAYTNDWEEYSVNYANMTPVTGARIGDLLISSSRAYNSADLKDYILGLNMAGTTTLDMALKSASTVVMDSRESTNPPYIEVKFLDTTKMFSLASKFLPLSVKPRVATASDIPFSLNLVSHNVNSDMNVTLGVKGNNGKLSVQTQPCVDFPFSLEIVSTNFTELNTFGGVTNPRMRASMFIPCDNELAFELHVRGNASSDIPAAFGVSSPMPTMNVKVMPDVLLPIELVVRQSASSDLPAAFGVSHTQGSFGINVKPVNDLEIDLAVRQSATSEIIAAFGVSHDTARLGVKVNPANDIDFSLNVRQETTSEVPFAILPRIAETRDISFEADVWNASKLPFSLESQPVRKIPVSMVVQPVSSIPFSIDVKSPFIPFDLQVRKESSADMPLSLIPRIRQVNDLPFKLKVKVYGASYVFIM